MYRIGVRKRFSAAHSLREYDGNCERLHGHNWLVEVVFTGEEADKIGMLLDFRVLKKALGEVLDELDHQHLNDLTPFKTRNPSSEFIAQHIFKEISRRITTGQIGAQHEAPLLAEVRVWESEDSWASYSE